MKRFVILIIVLVLIVIAGVAWKFGGSTKDNSERNGVAGNPIDITLDFYNSWLEHRKTGSNLSSLDDVRNVGALSDELRDQLGEFDFSSTGTGLDPVLCQTTLPEGFRSKPILEEENMVQLLILSSERGTSNQAAVSLEMHNGLWEITHISCNTGEQAPEIGEFSFEKTGHLLKSSLPNTFNKDLWHLVFEEAGVPGHTAPLIFDENSTCVDANGSSNTCNPDSTFREATEVRIQGQLTESGVDVDRLEVIAEPEA